MLRARVWMFVSAAALVATVIAGLPVDAQRAGGPGGAPQAPPDDAKLGVRLQIAEGTKAIYRVREQLAGISFPNDAVGTTTGVTGGLVIRPDGTVDSTQSTITVDLRTLKSDQDQRDGFLQSARGLDTEKFPTAVFVVKRVIGLSWPLPSQPPAQAGFQLVGDLTVYGKTQETTWNTVATFNPQRVAGRATTSFTFEKFGIPKPTLARLLSVDDTINLELEFRFTRGPM